VMATVQIWTVCSPQPDGPSLNRWDWTAEMSRSGQSAPSRIGVSQTLKRKWITYTVLWFASGDNAFVEGWLVCFQKGKNVVWCGIAQNYLNAITRPKVLDFNLSARPGFHRPNSLASFHFVCILEKCTPFALWTNWWKQRDIPHLSFQWSVFYHVCQHTSCRAYGSAMDNSIITGNATAELQKAEKTSDTLCEISQSLFMRPENREKSHGDYHQE
jgi:hypothetical protein